jgi:glutaredoxin
LHIPTIVLYTRTRCPLCDKAKAILLELQTKIDFRLEEVDIETDDKLTEEYGLMIPVVLLDGEEVQYGQIDKLFISKRLQEKLSIF